MNPAWDAAQAALALALDCLGESCHDYPRQLVETAQPIADCNTLAVVIGGARAHNGSCVGRSQLSVNLDITLIRCCDPVGELSAAGGYTPPTVEAIQAAVACLVRDAWAVYECLLCSACDVLGMVPGVTACCDDHTGAPEIMWGAPGGGCRSAVVRLPIVLTACCEPPPLAPCIDCAPDAPVVLTAAFAPGGGGCLRIEGSCLNLVDQIALVRTPPGATNFFDPAGPQGGDNSPSFVAVEWSCSVIEFCDPVFLSGATIEQISTFALGGVPNGLIDPPDFAVP